MSREDMKDFLKMVIVNASKLLERYNVMAIDRLISDVSFCILSFVADSQVAEDDQGRTEGHQGGRGDHADLPARHQHHAAECGGQRGHAGTHCLAEAIRIQGTRCDGDGAFCCSRLLNFSSFVSSIC